MVYSLFYLAARRNFKFAPKVLHRAEFLLERKFLCPFISYPRYSKDSEGNPKEDKKQSAPSGHGQAHINYIVTKVKEGKVPVDEVKSLLLRVVAEGQYKNYTQAPQTARCLGYATLAPMLGIPLLTLLTGHAWTTLVYMHLAYGATLLSFWGGTKWSDVVSSSDPSLEKLGWAVGPQIVGWFSLILPIPLGMLCTAFGYLATVVHDVLLMNYPPWVKSFRLIISAGTIVSLALMLIFYIILSRRRSWSSRSGSRSDSRSRSAVSEKKRTHSRSNSSLSHSRSRSVSREKSKSRKLSESSSSSSSSSSSTSSSSSRSKESPKKSESPPKITVPRYYGRNRKDSSSSLSLDSSDTDSKTNSGQPSSSNSSRNKVKKNSLDEHSSGGRSAGNARSASKQTVKEKPQEKLKKKMQALLNKQFRADKKAEKERLEKAEQERQDREAELRDIAIKIRRRERYLRHRGEDEENDGEREALRRRERYLRRSEEEEGKKVEKRDGECRSESSDSGKSKSKSPEGKSRRSRSPRRSRRSRSSSPKSGKLAKRTLVDY